MSDTNINNHYINDNDITEYDIYIILLGILEERE